MANINIHSLGRIARQQRLDVAIDRLASLFAGGHLMATGEPDALLNLACDEIEAARAGPSTRDAIPGSH